MVEKNYNRNGFLIQRKSYYKSGNIKSITIAKNDSVANSFFYTRSGKIKN
jgi:antitoxin component YwqK of YwqJK toxin-antitoxin module